MVNSKKKGNRGELEVAARLKQWFFEDYWHVERRGTSEEAAGKDLGYDLNTNLPLVAQVQFSDKPSPTKKYEEAEGALKASDNQTRLAVAFTKRTGTKWLATVDMDAFCALLASHIRVGSMVQGILGVTLPSSDEPKELARFMVDLLDMRSRADLAPFTNDVKGMSDPDEGRAEIKLVVDREALQKLVDGQDEHYRSIQREDGPIPRPTLGEDGELLN